jgi:hypothetical protein
MPKAEFGGAVKTQLQSFPGFAAKLDVPGYRKARFLPLFGDKCSAYYRQHHGNVASCGSNPTSCALQVATTDVSERLTLAEAGIILLCFPVL